MTGVEFVELETHVDARGTLTAFEPPINLPFEAKRVFVVQMPTPGVERAGHATSADQLIVVLHGAARFDLDDGRAKACHELRAGSRALRIRPGHWLRMVGTEPGTILFVAASRAFADTDYYTGPQAHLVEAANSSV